MGTRYSRKIRQHRDSFYVADDKLYRITRCLTIDIPVHMERVCQFWDDPMKLMAYMEEAMLYGTAYKVVDSDGRTQCFLYGIPQGKILCGMSFWCKLKRFAAMGYMYMRDHTLYHGIHWNPHKTDGYMPLAFLLENRMITDYRNGKEFVGIKLPDRKLEMLLHREKSKCGIEEVNGR